MFATSAIANKRFLVFFIRASPPAGFRRGGVAVNYNARIGCQHSGDIRDTAQLIGAPSLALLCSNVSWIVENFPFELATGPFYRLPDFLSCRFITGKAR